MKVQQVEQWEQGNVQLAPVEPAREEVPVQHWIELLASRNQSARSQAEYYVTRGDQKSIQALIATLERENRKKRWRFAMGMAIGVLVITAVSTAVSSLFRGHLQINGGAYLYGLTAGIGAGFAPTKLQRAVARILTQQDDIRAVGPLSEALDRQDEATKRLAAGALVRLLPRLTASDANLLSEHQRKMLWSTLLTTRTATLARGILNAALQTGDEKALASVQKVADGKGPGKKNSELREDARALIPDLERRIAEEHVRMTLLRPSESPDSAESILLRPAKGVESANPDVLLRPATPEPDGH